ncbi:MAG: DNA primase, partial [Pirellulales bacterium]
MSAGASFEVKERIKQAVDIVDLVGSYLSLRRAGRGYTALCPWHDDTRPSLQVNPQRQSFKCWVCDIGGDIFSFVMKMEGVSFPEALALLADRANISLAPPPRGAAPAAADDKRLLYQAMAWADQQYHECLLNDPCAAAARDYLAQRGIDEAVMRQFQLGFAPEEWDWIQKRPTAREFPPAALERVGLITRRQKGEGYYDRFRARVLFPIFDAQGRAVGLGGRVLPQAAPSDAAKYVNSPETPLFSKSQLLYGLHVARDAIRKTGTALVMEGYTDCIAAHQFGFTNAVAVLGTALGASHIQVLRRFAERVRVVLVLDGDEAGRKRAKEVLELFVAANVDLRVLTLPGGMDPADYLAAHGAGAFDALAADAADALTHAFHAATAGIDLQADVHASTQALEQLVATIAKAPRLRGDTEVEDRLREERFLQRLAFEFRVPEDQVRRLMTEQRRKTATRRDVAPPPAPTASVVTAIDPLERELLELLTQFPAMIEQVAGAIQPAQILSQHCRLVYAQCAELWSQGIEPELPRLLLENDDPVVKNLLVELDERGRAKRAGDADTRLQDVIAGFERRQHSARLQNQTTALKQRQLAEEDELAVLVELERRERARQQQNEQRASG